MRCRREFRQREEPSDDGRFLAYVSDESGRPEVFVRSFPDLERKWQASTEGGVAARAAVLRFAKKLKDDLDESPSPQLSATLAGWAEGKT